MKKFLVTILALFALVVPTFAADMSAALDITPILIASTPTTVSDLTSAAIDSRNFQEQLICVYTDTNASWSATDYLEIVLTECASSTGTFTPVAAGSLIGTTPSSTGVVATFSTATTAPAIAEFRYIGRYPYIKVKLDFTDGGAIGSPTVSVFAVQGKKIIAP